MCFSKLFRKHDHDFDPDDYDEPNVSIKKIDSFERMSLKESGMRFCNQYEILDRGDEVEVVLNDIRFMPGTEPDILVPREKGVIDKASFMKLIKDCNIASWDGFHGNHPKGVRDGIMFRFEAVVNDGLRMYADGSQNFPSHYREFKDALREALGNNKT